jgi:hypothetical protein
MDEAREKRNNQNTDPSGNNFQAFGVGFIIIFLYVFLWVILGSSFINLVNTEGYKTFFGYDLTKPPYSKMLKGGSNIFEGVNMSYGWPYSLRELGFLGSWFANTQAGAWSAPRYVLFKLFEFLQEVDDSIIFMFSPLLFVLALGFVPLIGFFGTFYGAFNLGENQFNQGLIGIYASIIMLLFGILVLLGGINSSLQSLAFFALIFYPLFTQDGRNNIKNIVNKYGNILSVFLGLFISINAFANLNSSYGIGMLIALAILYIPSLL